jgi:hypothetical protein
MVVQQGGLVSLSARRKTSKDEEARRSFVISGCVWRPTRPQRARPLMSGVYYSDSHLLVILHDSVPQSMELMESKIEFGSPA